MKDLNELMQSILDVDAAQRKAAETAQSQRRKRLQELPEREAKIRQECAQSAHEKAEKAALAQNARNETALAELAQKEKDAEAKLEATVAQHRGEWAAELARRVREG